MRVSAGDIVTLTGFPLLWRWTQESHAKLGPEELASIRPLRAAKAAEVLEQLRSNQVRPGGTEDRLFANDDLETGVVSTWIEARIPPAETDVFLLWDDHKAVLVPRRLFVDRWADFWYPGSDDLTVLSIVGPWRMEISHDGVFEFRSDGTVD